MSKLSQFLGGGGGGGGMPTEIASEDSIAPENTNLGINTSEGSVTITLPSDPEPGDIVTFFDAASTWDIYPAIIDTNGYRVEEDVSEVTTYTLGKRGGKQTLLYVGDNVGWKDMGLLDNGVSPIWYGSDLNSNYTIISNREDIELEVFDDITISGDFVIESSGVYIVDVAASAAGWDNLDESKSNVRPGNPSTVDVSNGIKLTSRTASDHDTALYQMGTVNVPTETISYFSGLFKLGILRTEPPERLRTYSDSALLGAGRLSVTPYGKRNYPLPTIYATSVALYLEEGDTLTFTLGAGGGVYGRRGGAGRGRVIRVTGIPL